MQDNYLAGGITIRFNCNDTVFSGNALYGNTPSDLVLTHANNVYASVPTNGVDVGVLPNAYEPGRAHAVVYNWQRQEYVSIDLSGTGLAIGAAFEIRDAQNYFGLPVATGVFNGASVNVPMTGRAVTPAIGNVPIQPEHTAIEFAVFVVKPSPVADSPAPKVAQSKPDAIDRRAPDDGSSAVGSDSLPRRSGLMSGETLYNGIELPVDWPPHPAIFPVYNPTPPYLVDPPSIIPIGLGRQLFVDDFLIESTNLSRTYHQPVYHPANPLIFPDRPWEGFFALAFSDGVFYDPSDQLFKMWYMAGKREHTALATSADGINWHKPSYDVLAGTNVVMLANGRDSNTVWLDHFETDPSKRFKMMWWRSNLRFESSSDGIHWGGAQSLTGKTGDRTTFFYNPFRSKWVPRNSWIPTEPAGSAVTPRARPWPKRVSRGQTRSTTSRSRVCLNGCPRTSMTSRPHPISASRCITWTRRHTKVCLSASSPSLVPMMLRGGRRSTRCPSATAETASTSVGLTGDHSSPSRKMLMPGTTGTCSQRPVGGSSSATRSTSI